MIEEIIETTKEEILSENLRKIGVLLCERIHKIEFNHLTAQYDVKDFFGLVLCHLTAAEYDKLGK